MTHTTTSGTVYAGNATLFVLLVTILVLLSITFSNWSNDSATRYAAHVCDAQGRDFATSGNCVSNTTETCLRAYESHTDGTCSFFPAPLTEPCYNICLIPTAQPSCNAKGGCISTNGSECIGVCNSDSDCNSDILINFDLVNSYDHTTFYTYAFYQPYMCFMGSCIYTNVHFLVGTLEQAYFHNASQSYELGVPLGIRNLCEDYIDPTYMATYGSCLEIQAYDLDPKTNWYPRLVGYANITYPLQQEMCVYRYKCATLDLPTWLASLSARQQKKRDIDPVRSRGYSIKPTRHESSWDGVTKRAFLDHMNERLTDKYLVKKK